MKRTITEWAGAQGKLFAQEVSSSPDRDNWSKLHDGDDMPEEDYQAMVAAFPDATDEALREAEECYKAHFNVALMG